MIGTFSKVVPLPPYCLLKGDVLHMSTNLSSFVIRLTSVSVRLGQSKHRVLSAWEAPILSSLVSLLLICVLLKLN